MNDMSLNSSLKGPKRGENDYFEGVMRTLGFQDRVTGALNTQEIAATMKRIANHQIGEINTNTEEVQVIEATKPETEQLETKLLQTKTAEKINIPHQSRKEVGHNKWDCYEMRNGKKVLLCTVESLDKGISREGRKEIKIVTYISSFSVHREKFESEELFSEAAVNNFLRKIGITSLSYKNIDRSPGGNKAWGKRK